MRPLIDSADPVIGYLARRREALAVEAIRLDLALIGYASQIRVMRRPPVVTGLEHFSMLDEETCGCGTCVEWHRRRTEFISCARLVPRGHKWSTCSCHVCRFIGRIQLNFLAATNRRDLLIAVSFHARHHSRHGERVMAWLAQEMQQPAYTLNWCAQEMSRYPVEWWLRRCEAQIGRFVSGPVFQDSTTTLDFQMHFPSTLMAMVEL